MAFIGPSTPRRNPFRGPLVLQALGDEQIVSTIARRMVLLGGDDMYSIVDPGHVMTVAQYEACVREHLRGELSVMREGGKLRDFMRRYSKYLED